MTKILNQIKIAIAVLLGVLLVIPCLLHAWTPATYPSTKPWPSGEENVPPSRPKVDQWRWAWLNHWYANIEDGVSALYAWIWGSGENAGKLVPYASTFNFPTWLPKYLQESIVAICWNVWRNNANNLKRSARDDKWAPELA